MISHLIVIIFFSLFSLHFCEELTGDWGEFVSCPSGEAVTSICGSGKNHDCKDQYGNMVCTIIDCEKWGKLPNYTKKIPSDLNGWKCGSWGVHLSCPQSQAIIGVCGSGKNLDCQLNCDTDSAEAILCGLPPSPYAVATDGNWHAPTQWGIFGVCGNGTVACGSCSSGSNPDCDGEWNRIQCCSFLDCTPSSNVGFWQFVKSGSTAGESITTEYGVDISASVELTESLSETYSESVSRGFTFKSDDDESSKGIEVTQEYSKTVSQSVSASFEVSITKTTTAECSFAPYVLWQFRFDSYGNCPASTFTDSYACTNTAAQPPCCLPGYALDEKYSTCVAGSPNLCTSKISVSEN